MEEQQYSTSNRVSANNTPSDDVTNTKEGHNELATMSFGCMDLNELWAAAIPMEDEDTLLVPNFGTTTANDLIVPQGNDLHLQEEEDLEETEVTISQFKNSSDCEIEVREVHHEQDVVVSADRKGGKQQQQHQPRPSKSTFAKAVEVFKYIYSGALLVFCIAVVMAAIFNKQTTATADNNTPPAVAFIVFWFLILWLALMEGGLNCMVGLKPLDKSLYAESHKLTHICTKKAHRGDNLERFIVGRQFLDLTCVFLTSFMVSSIDGASVFGLPAIVNDIFLGAGVAVILVTIVIGQLISQINAAHCMLDFINNYAMVATTYAALALENSGLLHSVYLIQIIVAKIAGREIESAEGPRSRLKKTWFWTRVVFSTILLGFAFAVTFKALFDRTTTMWSSVPPPASIALLVFLILVVGNMEGLQIAMIAVVHLPEEELVKHPVAYKNCRLTFRGSNLQAFLVGRQIFQTILMFVIARITTLDVGDGDDSIFGVGKGLQLFFNTGVLGALISTIVASLSWRILASTFPIAFLASPFANITIRFCLFVEHTGICSVSWILAAVHRKLARLQVDEIYVGRPADRVEAAECLTSKKEHSLEQMEDGCTSSESS